MLATPTKDSTTNSWCLLDLTDDNLSNVLTSKCKGGCYHSSTIQSKTVTILPHPHWLCLVKPSHRHKSVLEVSPFRHCSFCIFAGLKLYDQCRSCFIPNMINNFPKLLKMSHMHLIISSIIFTYRFPNTCFRLVVQTCNYYQLYNIYLTYHFPNTCFGCNPPHVNSHKQSQIFWVKWPPWIVVIIIDSMILNRYNLNIVDRWSIIVDYPYLFVYTPSIFSLVKNL